MTYTKILGKSNKSKWLHLSLFLTTFLLVTHINFFGMVKHFSPNYSYSTIVLAQRLTPEVVAQKVYEKIPDLPKGNDYISVSSGERAIENTLVSRMIRYHEFVKARPLTYRLDWKLTLADYLRKNEIIDEQRYPGRSTLTQNPLEFDRAIIDRLTMQQREELVNVLVSIYNPTPEETKGENRSKPSESSSPPSSGFVLPQPGDANLLLP
ncbi:hypothetical protein ACN4EE_06660 [Geminocystis sp. CENA526]|uniref:hypothetical protein n=1 Tax=Geminocystis sp. CENA526 TaxID=1355871 RepID=UPI003D6E2E5D